jgi:hypothetical protein
MNEETLPPPQATVKAPQYAALAALSLKETSVLATTSTAFVIGITVVLVALAILYAASAVKQHVNASNTVEAMFKGVDEEYLKEFVIKRPETPQGARGGRALKVIQKQFDRVEAKLMKLMRALNPNLVSETIQAKRTTLCDITKEKFLSYDPMIARIFVFLLNSLNCLVTTLFCLKTDTDNLSALPQAT